jgi:hypothetical protein
MPHGMSHLAPDAEDLTIILWIEITSDHHLDIQFFCLLAFSGQTYNHSPY